MAARYGSAPQEPASGAVVSPQFCAPYAVPLTVTKKAISLSGGDFVVTDANGAEMLRVNGAIFSIHDRRVLLDAAGQPLLSMREKVFSMHNRWEVFKGDSTKATDLLFTGTSEVKVSNKGTCGSSQRTKRTRAADPMHRAIIACCRRALKAAAIDLRDMMPAPYREPPAAAATAAAPVAVVSPQFCSPDVVPLTVTKEPKFFSDGNFTVTDANGAVVLRVEGNFFNNHRVLLDAAGLPILSMRKNVPLFSSSRWEVFRGESSNASDLLFTAKKSSIFQVKTEMDILLASNTAKQVWDFKIKQDSYIDRSCAFYHGNSNNMIAQTNQQSFFFNLLFGMDISVTVFPHVDYVFITALVVILDEIQREELRRREQEWRRRQN